MIRILDTDSGLDLEGIYLFYRAEGSKLYRLAIPPDADSDLINLLLDYFSLGVGKAWIKGNCVFLHIDSFMDVHEALMRDGVEEILFAEVHDDHTLR